MLQPQSFSLNINASKSSYFALIDSNFQQSVNRLRSHPELNAIGKTWVCPCRLHLDVQSTCMIVVAEVSKFVVSVAHHSMHTRLVKHDFSSTDVLLLCLIVVCQHRQRESH